MARFENSAWVKEGLEGLGIGVRVFPGKAGLENAVRITCPGNDAVFARLCDGLKAVLQPEAMIFDLDGVLADVSGSYRKTIIETAAAFGVQVSSEDIADMAVFLASDAARQITGQAMAVDGHTERMV